MQLDTLDQIDIGSSEGVCVDDLLRARMHFLVGQHLSIVTQTQTADAKAAALLAGIGLASTQGLAEFGGGLAIPVAALTLGAALLALMVLFPRMPRHRTARALSATDRFSWPALAASDYTADDYASFMRTSQASQLVISAARSNAATAQVLQRKFRLLRLAFLVATADLLAISAGLALGATFPT